MAYKFERTRTASAERIEREQAARDWAAIAIVVAGLVAVWALI